MNSYRIPFYEKNIQRFSANLKQVKRKHALVSLLRLLFFLALLISWLYIVTLNVIVGVILGTVFLISFFVLLKIHKSLEDTKKYLETILEININEKLCCSGNFSAFDTGKEFLDIAHPYSYDVDLFGEGSLFQYINRTVSNKGKKLLANWLLCTPLSTDKILENQSAIKELASLNKFTQNFITKGKLFASDNHEEKLIKKWMQMPAFFKRKKIAPLVLNVIPAINLTLLALMIFGVISWLFLALIIVVNITIVGFRFREFNVRYELLSRSHQNIKKTTGLLHEIEKTEFESEILNKLKSGFFLQNKSASRQINQLTKLLDALDNRNNILLAFLFNSFLLWDWNYMWRIEKWQKTHKLEYEKWQESIAEFDALISLSNLYFNNPDFNFPTLSDQEYELKVSEIGHPLLKNDIRVCNNFNLNQNQRYAIITGANMAGKSTFLRTVATNLVLAGCGSAVCAKEFCFTPLPMYSSMRTEDSLMKNESYFFAELKHLQQITKELDKGNKLFIILDEILRGTNSEDKRKGSIGFVKKITEKMAHGIVATHDLELARLAEQQPNVFKAMCFEVSFKNNELNFNYKLQQGVTKNMNASFLMTKMGIID